VGAARCRGVDVDVALQHHHIQVTGTQAADRLRRVVLLHVHLDVRVALGERDERRRDDRPDGGLDGPDRHPPRELAAQSGDCLPRLDQLRLDALGRVGEDAAGRRESHATGSSVQHVDALFRLQAGDLLRDGGGCDVQKIGRRENPAGPVDGEEKSESARVRSHVAMLHPGVTNVRLC
jgi:hypothetical protein